MPLTLTEPERAMLAGDEGPAAAFALRILSRMAEVWEAESLLEVECAHVDGCLYHGYSGLEFAERLVADGARVRVPTTSNVGAADLLHPEHFRGDPQVGAWGRRMMACYEEMGCRPIWTCAPYQAEARPAVGSQIAWAESNAIVFANSVLGARTNRYGDFIDICAAITARAPAVGLHLTENRRGGKLFRLTGVSDRLLAEDVVYPVIGYLVGTRVGTGIPVIDGLPATTSEDQLKALGAAAASSGAVALFHAIGVTPEAPSLEAAFHGEPPPEPIALGPEELRSGLAQLSTVPDGAIEVVALGSPHFSVPEFEALMPLVRRHPPRRGVEFFVCTHRLVYAALAERGWLAELEELGVEIVVDTCVVVTPIVRARPPQAGALMTNSGKFAHYTPGNLGLGVIYGSLEECVRSAAAGRVWRDADLWSAP